MKGSGPDPWPPDRGRRVALVVGLIIGLIIVAVLAWVIGTWPRPGWRNPVPQVPTAPASAPEVAPPAT